MDVNENTEHRAVQSTSNAPVLHWQDPIHVQCIVDEELSFCMPPWELTGGYIMLRHFMDVCDQSLSLSLPKLSLCLP